MAIKYTSADIAKNSVRTKKKMSPPLEKTKKADKPTMRSTAKDKPLTAKQIAKGNARGLKAANKGLTTKSAEAARLAAAKRALAVPPSQRTAAQKLALKRVPNIARGGGAAAVRLGAGGGMNWQTK